jgi:DNA modification methylase
VKHVYRLIQGDVLQVLPKLESESVDLIVTSPPYWGLRDYGIQPSVWGGNGGCEHEWEEKSVKYHEPHHGEGSNSTFHGQTKPLKLNHKSTQALCVKCNAWRGTLGLEPHPKQYINHLAAVCLELKRVLKKSGCFFLNLGDTYFGGKGKSAHNYCEKHFDRNTIQTSNYNIGEDRPQDICSQDDGWLQPKQKLLIPSRVAIRLQEQGWILRNNIIWHKPNHMPSSVRDRFTNSYEQVFFFVKARRYWFDLDAVRVPHNTTPEEFTAKATVKKPVKPIEGTSLNGGFSHKKNGLKDYLIKHGARQNPKGKNPGDVFLKQDNVPGPNAGMYRGFNKRWKQSMREIYGDDSKGNRRSRVRAFLDTKENIPHPKGKNPSDFWQITTRPYKGAHFAVFPPALVTQIIKCACPPEGMILDPFIGSGTTMLAAQQHGRSCTGIEISLKYCKEHVLPRCFNGQTLGIDEYLFEQF